MQQLSEFLETFVRNFCTICRCFQIFESFGWMESAPCLLASNRFFECAHPIIDKPMVTTEPTVLSARLLGLGSKLFKWWMAICMDWQSTWHFRGLALHSQFFLQERELDYTRELIVIVHCTCPDHLLNSPSSLDTSVSAACMVSCALSNSIFSCVASWVLNSNLINKKTDIKEKDNWVVVNKNIQASIMRFSEARREGSIYFEMFGLEIGLLVRNGQCKEYDYVWKIRLILSTTGSVLPSSKHEVQLSVLEFIRHEQWVH